MRSSDVSALLLLLWDCFLFVYASSSTSFPAMFFMGASMLDVGTNRYANSTNYPASPPYARDRFSNGLIIADFLGAFAGLPPVPPYLEPGANFSYGANFASAGSGLLSTTGRSKGVVPFFDQLAQFAYLTQSLLKYDLENSPVVINAGTNDMQDYIDYSPLASRPFARMLSNNLRDALRDLYNLGARKFLIIGISPLGCIPENRLKSMNRACYEPLNELVTMYNDMMQASLDDLRAELKNLQLLFFDAFSFTQGMIKNGAQYGFQMIEKRCCGAGELNAVVPCRVGLVCEDPETYLYWDYHPTQRAYSIISEAIWSTFIEALNHNTVVQEVRYNEHTDK